MSDIQFERKNPPKERFEIKGLFTANVPTTDGYVYSLETLRLIEKQILTAKPRLTIQELHSPIREKKGVPQWEPVKSLTMAVIVDANVIDGSLDLICESRATRDGKKLSGMRMRMPESIEYIPVGYGNERKVGKFTEVINYILKYVTVETEIL